MAAMDPGAALATGEQALRQLLNSALPDALGAEWLAKVTKPEQRSRWQSRKADEAARRRKKGVAVVPADELAYAELYELIDIAQKQWTHVAEALGKKADTGALLRRMEDLRNTVGHSRQLLPFEADLLSGIAGELRNRVTMYMSSKDPGGEYYPRIESVVDNFGFSSDMKDNLGIVRTRLTIPYGSAVRFVCKGTDPQGRDLSWRLSTYLGTVIETTGNDVELQWVIASSLEVGETSRFHISLQSSGEYHRHGSWDDDVTFWYTVTPPANA